MPELDCKCWGKNPSLCFNGSQMHFDSFRGPYSCTVFRSSGQGPKCDCNFAARQHISRRSGGSISLIRCLVMNTLVCGIPLLWNSMTVWQACAQQIWIPKLKSKGGKLDCSVETKNSFLVMFWQKPVIFSLFYLGNSQVDFRLSCLVLGAIRKCAFTGNLAKLLFRFCNMSQTVQMRYVAINQSFFVSEPFVIQEQVDGVNFSQSESFVFHNCFICRSLSMLKGRCCVLNPIFPYISRMKTRNWKIYTTG